MTDHFTLRLPAQTTARLRRLADRSDRAPRTLAQRYIEEGIRREEHPQIHFVDRPTGRQPVLLGTRLEVADVIATVRDNENDLAAAARYLGRPLGLIQAAVAYYGEYRDEVDARIARKAEDSERAYAAYVAGERALRA